MFTTLFCDKTGMGAPDEPALTPDQLKEKLHAAVLLAIPFGRTVGFAIVEEGQFQVKVGVFRKLPRHDA